jgi:hypothetical protein
VPARAAASGTSLSPSTRSAFDPGRSTGRATQLRLIRSRRAARGMGRGLGRQPPGRAGLTRRFGDRNGRAPPPVGRGSTWTTGRAPVGGGKQDGGLRNLGCQLSGSGGSHVGLPPDGDRKRPSPLRRGFHVLPHERPDGHRQLNRRRAASGLGRVSAGSLGVRRDLREDTPTEIGDLFLPWGEGPHRRPDTAQSEAGARGLDSWVSAGRFTVDRGSADGIVRRRGPLSLRPFSNAQPSTAQSDTVEADN